MALVKLSHLYPSRNQRKIETNSRVCRSIPQFYLCGEVGKHSGKLFGIRIIESIRLEIRKMSPTTKTLRCPLIDYCRVEYPTCNLKAEKSEGYFAKGWCPQCNSYPYDSKIGFTLLLCCAYFPNGAPLKRNSLLSMRIISLLPRKSQIVHLLPRSPRQS